MGELASIYDILLLSEKLGREAKSVKFSILVTFRTSNRWFSLAIFLRVIISCEAKRSVVEATNSFSNLENLTELSAVGYWNL